MFITNQRDAHNLKRRLVDLISASEELNILVGFFYFSGWREMVDAMRNNPELKIKILVGLEADYLSGRLVEFARDETLPQIEVKNSFLQSLTKSLNYPGFDNKEFSDHLNFFLQLLEENRMEIRKTLDPNHAKLYLFKLKNNIFQFDGSFITGSSNLTRPGLNAQQEFNIEVHDFGYEEARQYFDDLWESAIPLEAQLIKKVVQKTIWSEVKPFEAYMYVLKTYLETLQITDNSDSIRQLLRQAGFKEYKYQIDAVNQGLHIIDHFGGVIIADVVGLGKSVIASLIANRLNVSRGLILVPPGLIGDDLEETGWKGYMKKFGITHWDILSVGKIQNKLEENPELFNKYEAVIVDEAHRFRNEDTASYEALSQITRGKKVILLTATPFNNSPSDIFSLLKLFIVPGESPLSFSEDLQMLFSHYKSIFQKAGFILRNATNNHLDKEKKKKVLKAYKELTGEEKTELNPADLKEVKHLVKEISTKIKEIISPVVIRRNRLDLKKDPFYRKEISDLSRVKAPEEIFFQLNENQLNFYEKIITEYFGKQGKFKGAIYKPYVYEKQPDKELEIEENREILFQKNLFDFMRRLLVKRFESSFGAFKKTVERFLQSHKVALEFIEQSGRYFLDRDILESIWQDDEEFTEEKIQEALDRFQNRSQRNQRPRQTKIYEVDQFKFKQKFLDDIASDIQLFEQILEEIDQLQLVTQDSKRETVIRKVQEIIDANETPKRKVVIFSEYADTVRYLKDYFEKQFKDRFLYCDGKLTSSLSRKIEMNFNAQLSADQQEDNYDILLTTDKLSEGGNLNRAGIIINYDIPWNPTRVIQRVGRINRIGEKVFDELYIFNLFPTKIGADIIQSKEIAAQKMFMIHNALGEDVRIFDADEQPSASELYKRINTNPDELEEEVSLITRIRTLWEKNLKLLPDDDNRKKFVEKLHEFPNRIKSSKKHSEEGLVMLKRKGLSLYALYKPYKDESKIEELEFESLHEKIKCAPQEKLFPLSNRFWKDYKELQEYKWTKTPNPDNFLNKAYNSLETILRDIEEEDLREFVINLREDLRKYKTLPRYTLRRLIIEDNQDKDSVIQNIRKLMNILDKNYLDKIKEKTKNYREEIIIAIENQY